MTDEKDGREAPDAMRNERGNERTGARASEPGDGTRDTAPVDSVLAAKARAKAKRAEAKAAGGLSKTVGKIAEKLVGASGRKRGRDRKAAAAEGVPPAAERPVPPTELSSVASPVALSPVEVPPAEVPPAEVPPAELPPAELPLPAVHRLLVGAHRTPHAILGAHPASHDGVNGVVIRALFPSAVSIGVVLQEAAGGGETVHDMEDRGNGLHTLFLPGLTLPLRYKLRIAQRNGGSIDRDDPYRFLPSVGEVDLHLFGEGRHLRLWQQLGAHPRVMDGVSGTAFAVWAPNATRVSLIGSFNAWDTRVHPMRALGSSGVWELFVPGVGADALYKYEIAGPTGALRVKTDPMAFQMELSSGHASVVVPTGVYEWNDSEWLRHRAERDPVREPMLVYEVHLASWARVPEENNRSLTYREIAPRLADHVKQLGFTHVELLPILEHPFGGSWGYQVSGYYAPTSRHGTPDDFRFLVDTLHAAGIGVLLDWVPAHFPKDDWALRRFDGTACYEHEDPRLGEHPEWGTLIFNYGRHEVRNFLLANALFWIEEFHIDGLRVDAVASMLYLDYGREAGQWMRNRFGGRENLEAVSFLKQLNHTVHTTHRGVSMIAEESTTWPRVTHPIAEGGLGFTFKWNMGWMHDTLDYFRIDPLFRRGAHNKLTFALMYEFSERFVNPLSHDEVVHLKKSLLEKMPGDAWQKLANLRALIAYSVTRPGKSLFFMGVELAAHREWNHDSSLDWHLLNDPRRRGLMDFITELSALYKAESCFWRHDHEPAGFSWIDVGDREQSVLSYARWDGTEHAMVVLNLTPVPRPGYRVGAPAVGSYRHVLNSDDVRFGGSGFPIADTVSTESEPCHGFLHSVVLTLPPLSAIVLRPEPGTHAAELVKGEGWATASLTVPSTASDPVGSNTVAMLEERRVEAPRVAKPRVRRKPQAKKDE